MNLKEARVKQRYSKRAVAELLGVTPPTYARMESQPEEIRAKYIPKLAKLFGISIKDFFLALDLNLI